MSVNCRSPQPLFSKDIAASSGTDGRSSLFRPSSIETANQRECGCIPDFAASGCTRPPGLKFERELRKNRGPNCSTPAKVALVISWLEAYSQTKFCLTLCSSLTGDPAK